MGPCQALTKHVGSRLEIVAWTVDGGDVETKEQPKEQPPPTCCPGLWHGIILDMIMINNLRMIT